jgi:UDP-3-O-[3-hydroxymyristoyl] glucosamine N-acyltransferase
MSNHFKIGNNKVISKLAEISDDSIIGSNVIIKDNIKILRGVIIGDNCIIGEHSHNVIFC